MHAVNRVSLTQALHFTQGLPE